MKKTLILLALATTLFASNYKCETKYKDAVRLTTSSNCNDNRQAAIIIKELDYHRCEVIGTDGEYQLELKLDKKIERCNRLKK